MGRARRPHRWSAELFDVYGFPRPHQPPNEEWRSRVVEDDRAGFEAPARRRAGRAGGGRTRASRDRGGFTAEVEVDRAAVGVRGQLVRSIARELLVNALPA